jgi:hypothetical protein
MPTSFPLTLSDSDFVSSARLRLGLPVRLANAPAIRCDCRTTVLPVDSNHPLTYTCLALQQTSRHDFVTTSWRCIPARAGVHTTAEPPFRFFPAHSPPPAFLSAGPALASSSGGGVAGLWVLVPDAPALAPAAALALPADPAPSPSPGAPYCSPDPLGIPPPLGPGARGDVIFVFPRRLVVGDVSGIHPAAAFFAEGAAVPPGLRPLPGTPPSGVRIGRCPPPFPSCRCRSNPSGAFGPRP